MMHELIQIGDGYRTIDRNANGEFLLPLRRGVADTKVEAHPEGGLWAIVSAPGPADFSDLGPDTSRVLLRLPALDEQTHTVLVGEKAANYVDLGMVITRYDVVE